MNIIQLVDDPQLNILLASILYLGISIIMCVNIVVTVYNMIITKLISYKVFYFIYLFNSTLFNFYLLTLIVTTK